MKAFGRLEIIRKVYDMEKFYRLIMWREKNLGNPKTKMGKAKSVRETAAGDTEFTEPPQRHLCHLPPTAVS
jgi:hypothetical protein